MAQLNADERRKCWSCRDMYFECLAEKNDNTEFCKDALMLFETACPKRWISYFVNQRKKDILRKKLETEGVRYTDETSK